MRWVFALSLIFIVGAYAGYPLWAYLKSVWRPRPGAFCSHLSTNLYCNRGAQ